MDPHRLRKAPNIAIVGSTSLLGKELQEMLDDRALPMGRLTLLETEDYAGSLERFKLRRSFLLMPSMISISRFSLAAPRSCTPTLPAAPSSRISRSI
jgi:aspartate-semialdehyde dehydrogenase